MIQKYEQFWCLRKGSGTWFSTTFCVRFFTEVISHFKFYQLIKFHFLLPLLFEILDNIFIAIICCPVFNVINFEIDLSFHIRPFFYITKTSGQKCKYLKIQKSCKRQIRNIFIIFKPFKGGEEDSFFKTKLKHINSLQKTKDSNNRNHLLRKTL